MAKTVEKKRSFPHTWVVYICLVALLLIELGLSLALYRQVLTVEQRCNTEIQAISQRTRRSRRAVTEDNTVSGETNVEFFHPKLRQELEEKEAARKAAAAAAAGGRSPEDNNPWVWLTSYSRIPLVAIQGFCSATRDYCPPGPIGPQGLPGMGGEPGYKGDRGDRGFPGEPGLRGPPGISGENGPRGPKGEHGDKGDTGYEGRDGIPGEPGLDGVPGRNGLDGLPGKNGVNGFHGMAGKPGYNGTDGKPGSIGPPGPAGKVGPHGLPGPRGRPGKAGHHGTAGIPGISAWVVNGTQARELLIPPSIAGATSILDAKPTVVHEGENVRMRCAASGHPRPDVEWRRLDNPTIPLGSWQVISASGHTLNITRISRVHMGKYQCIANNGVPPEANKTFSLEVHFLPHIRIETPMVGAANGSVAKLECYVEAFPEAVRYWERADGRLLESGDKYRIAVIENGRYKAHMQLNITRITHSDFGRYHCVSKNELGLTRAVFTVFEVDPRLATPPPVQVGGSRGVSYGQKPPELVDYNDLCPAPPECPECPIAEPKKCHDGGLSLFDLIRKMEIRPFGNETYPGLPNRTLDCVLYAIGKPVYHRFINATYGSWMRDPQPRNDIASDKYWGTNEGDPYHLNEFANKTMFRRGPATRNYTLPFPFKGNSHVIFNGSFYYNQMDRPRIIRYDLTTENVQAADLPYAPYSGDNYLYTTEYNYVDFSVDENGLWVVYGLPENNNTVVIKLDAFTLTRQYAWNISVNHHKVGEMFIVCGVLYAVDSVTERDTKIRFALDLYRNVLLDVTLPFTNPFRKTTMIGYNAKNKELYTWDKGNQLTYPVRYNAIGNNTSKEESSEIGDASAQIQTGVLKF